MKYGFGASFPPNFGRRSRFTVFAPVIRSRISNSVSLKKLESYVRSRFTLSKCDVTWFRVLNRNSNSSGDMNRVYTIKKLRQNLSYSLVITDLHPSHRYYSHRCLRFDFDSTHLPTLLAELYTKLSNRLGS